MPNFNKIPGQKLFSALHIRFLFDFNFYQSQVSPEQPTQQPNKNNSEKNPTIIRLCLTPGSVNGCARNDDAGRPTVIADGNVFPVGHQRIVLTTEHYANISSVRLRGVEVRVIA